MVHATRGPGHEGKASEHQWGRTAPPCPSASPAMHRRVSGEHSDSKDVVSRCGGVLAAPADP